MKNSKLGSILPMAFILYFILMVVNPLIAQDLNPVKWPHLKGYWKYQNIAKLTKASVGKDLTLVGTHLAVSGPSVGDTAIRIGIGSYYNCYHNMAPNGGGDSVNQYTLMFDFKVLSLKKWHTFFKTDSNNNNDGECFIRPITGSNPGRIGVGATGYSNDSISPNQWYRLIISVNLNHFYRYYINGQLFHEGDTQAVDGRFALTPKMVFFGDDNQEDDTIDIASVAVFDTCLTASDIAKIGSIDPCVAKPPKLSLGRDTALCDYNTIVKNAGIGYKKYQWYNGSTQSSITLTKNIGLGKRNIWCKVTDVNGCVVADTFALTYISSPIVNLGPDLFFCEGVSTKLMANADTILKYKWYYYLANTTVISTKNQIIANLDGKYFVDVKNQNGCVSTDTILLTQLARPGKPSIAANRGKNICAGESVTLSGPTGYTDYIWSNGLHQQSIVVNTNSVLKLKVVNSNNCESIYSDSVVVKVFAKPLQPNLQLFGNDSFCIGDSVLLNAPSGYKNYLWNDGSGNASRYFKSTQSCSVQVTDSIGCVSPISVVVKVVAIALPAPPSVQIMGASFLCNGESTVLSVPAGFAKYKWSNTVYTPLDTIKTSGTYSVIVSNIFGCSNASSNTVKITVYPVPLKPSVIKITADTLQCSTIDSSYEWARNGVVLSIAKRNLKTLASGYYQARTTNTWCLSPWSDSFLHTNVSIQNSKYDDLNLLLTPNPFSTELKLQLNTEKVGEQIGITILDLAGREIGKWIAFSEQLNAGIDLQLADLTMGQYVIKIQGEQWMQTAKLIKQ